MLTSLATGALSNSNGLKATREELLDKISKDDNLPTLGNAVAKVVQLASSHDEGVRNLAYFIMSDVGLTQKILRIANAACFRGSAGTPVTTISRAIFLLGFDAVKTCALGMLLIDRISGHHAVNVRGELMHALGASIFGRELARRGQFKEAEEATIAALFRNMGRLLVASHDHELYAQINQLTDEGISPQQAAVRLLGCSLEALAQSVMTEWDIPESIIHAQAPLPGGVLKSARNRQEWMQQVAAFSSAAADLVMHGRGTEKARAALLTRFGKALEVDDDCLRLWMEMVVSETDMVAGQMRLDAIAAESNKESANANDQEMPDQHPVVEETEGSALPTELLLDMATEKNPTQIIGKHASGKPLNARELLMAGVQDVMEMMASGRCKTNDLIMLVLETLYRGMGFRFVTICLKDVKAGQYRSRIALGENNAALQAGFAFPINASRNLFHLAMKNDADLLISDSSDPKIRDLIPAWHQTLLPDARSFIVLPLVVQKNPVGLFYADRDLPASEGMPPEETAMIKLLKGQVITALNTH